MSQVFSLDDKFAVEKAGVKYELSLPSFKDLKWLREETKGKEADEIGEVYVEFLTRCGLPKEVSESLPAATIVRVANALISPDPSKKN